LLFKEVSAFGDYPFYALIFYAENDKEWRSDKEAQEVFRQLSTRQRAVIEKLDRQVWPRRSKRPERLVRNWKNLFKEIASDVNLFERYIDNPPAADELSGTIKRINSCYRKQAIKLLGGGTYIAPHRRHLYVNLLDEADKPGSLLTPNGRLPSKSIFPVQWFALSARDRREALKLTVHWFHHALRNLREYRNRRSPIPWNSDCELECRRIQRKVLSGKS
jgi:hypothetical protein